MTETPHTSGHHHSDAPLRLPVEYSAPAARAHSNSVQGSRSRGHVSDQQQKSKTKIRIIEDAEAQGATAEAYDFWRKGSGRQQVPGIIKCFGARPDFLRQMVEFSNTIHFSEGHLQRRHKEMIASYVSYLNRCPY